MYDIVFACLTQSMKDWFEHFIMRDRHKYLGSHPFQAFYIIQYLSQCFVLDNIYQDNLSLSSNTTSILKETKNEVNIIRKCNVFSINWDKKIQVYFLF